MNRRARVLIIVFAAIVVAAIAVVAGAPSMRLYGARSSVRVLISAVERNDAVLLASRLHEATYRLNYWNGNDAGPEHPPGVQWRQIGTLVGETDHVIRDRFRYVSAPFGIAVFGWDGRQVRVAGFSRSPGAWRLMELVTPWPTSFEIRLQAGAEATRRMYRDCVMSLDEKLLLDGYLDPYSLKESKGERPQNEIDAHNRYVDAVAWPARERLDHEMCNCLRRAAGGARCSNPDTPFGDEEPESSSDYSEEEDVE